MKMRPALLEGPPAALDAHGREGVLPRRIPPSNVP